MRISIGPGAAIYVTLRREGGICLHQGTSKIWLSTEELTAVLDAITDLQGSRVAATGKTDNGIHRTNHH